VRVCISIILRQLLLLLIATIPYYHGAGAMFFFEGAAEKFNGEVCIENDRKQQQQPTNQPAG